MKIEEFGLTKDGQMAHLYTLENEHGMKAIISDFGAVLVSLLIPDRNGVVADVVLGMRTVAEYEHNDVFLGACVGRSANRIGGAQFTLNGQVYHLAVNDGPNNLHSCPGGYHERMWQAETDTEGPDESVTFSLHSPDGDQGYPGALDIAVTYTLTAANALMIHYNGVADADTVINLTNHSYFNLAGEGSGSAMDQLVWIDSDFFTHTDAGSIPDGELVPVEGTVMDFRTEKPIGRDIESDYEPLIAPGGFDHNWVLKNGGELAVVASLTDPASGRKMTVHTDLPGIQFYAGNSLAGQCIGKSGKPYGKREGVCFESQYFPNAVNIPSFKSPVKRAGEPYDTTTIYSFETV